jgi:hypothetical protein
VHVSAGYGVSTRGIETVQSTEVKTPAKWRDSSNGKSFWVALTVIFVSLAAISIRDYAIDLYRDSHAGALPVLSPPTMFYSDVFTVMICTDVLILILSLLVSDHYELVFRNAAFVISTVLIRFSLTAGHPYEGLLGLAGIVFGIHQRGLRGGCRRSFGFRNPAPPQKRRDAPIRNCGCRRKLSNMPGRRRG